MIDQSIINQLIEWPLNLKYLSLVATSTTVNNQLFVWNDLATKKGGNLVNHGSHLPSVERVKYESLSFRSCNMDCFACLVA